VMGVGHVRSLHRSCNTAAKDAGNTRASAEGHVWNAQIPER
jgi:hypothetical protein